MIFLFIGLIFVGCYATLPHLWCWIHRSSGQVWVPINSSLKYGSDDNIYASLVNSLRLNGMKLRWPVTGCGHLELFETLRIATYRLTAILGLGFSEPRVFHFAAFLGGISLNYFFAYLASRATGLDDLAASFAALSYMLWIGAIRCLPNLRLSIQHIRSCLLNAERRMYFDLINDNFRYAILSTGGVWIGLTLALTEMSLSQHGWWLASLGLLAAILPFTYPGVAFPSCVYMAARLLFGCFNDEFIIDVSFFLIGFAPIILWFHARGALKALMKAVLSPPAMLVDMHLKKNSAKTSWKKSFRAVRKGPLPLALSSYIISYFIESQDQLSMNSAALVVACILALSQFMPKFSIMAKRIYERGGLSFHSIVFLVTLGGALETGHAAWLISALIVCMTVPALGLLRMCETHARNQIYCMDRQRWQALRWLGGHVPIDATVCCLDIADMQLQTVYGSGRAYIGGAEWLQSPTLALSKYFQVLTLCDISHQIVRDWVRDFAASKAKFQQPLPAPPPDESDVEGVLFLNRMLYQPYMKMCDGVTMTDDSGGWSQAFLQHLHVLSTQAVAPGWAEPKPDFILLSARFIQRRGRQDASPDGYVQAASFAGNTVYQKQYLAKT